LPSKAENITPIFIEGIAIDFRDEACGTSMVVGSLTQPALSYFQLEGMSLDLNTSTPPQGNSTGQGIMLKIDDVPGRA